MSQFSIIHRYDSLRIRFIAEDWAQITPGEAAALLRQRVELAGACHTVVVELLTGEPVSDRAVAVLDAWRRVARIQGRRFRLNGPSLLVDQIQQRWSGELTGNLGAAQSAPRSPGVANLTGPRWAASRAGSLVAR